MTTRSWIRTELKKNYEKANRTAREAERTEPRAVEARYLPGSRHLRVRLTNGARLSLPVAIIPELRKATAVQLAGIELLPGGDGLHWEALNFTISVPGLVASLFGRSVWMPALCRLGGSRATPRHPADRCPYSVPPGVPVDVRRGASSQRDQKSVMRGRQVRVTISHTSDASHCFRARLQIRRLLRAQSATEAPVPPQGVVHCGGGATDPVRIAG